MDGGRPADKPDRERELDRPDQVPRRVPLPGRERTVSATLPGRIRMGPCLDGPEVVARRDDDGVDPVHDALVMGGTAERIRVRECERLKNSLDDLLTGDVVRLDRVLREYGTCSRETLHREVRDDP